MNYKIIQQGEEQVCEAVHKYAVKCAQKSYDEGKADGIKIGNADGITEGTVKTLINLVNSGNITTSCAIANSGLSKEEFMSIAKKLGLSY